MKGTIIRRDASQYGLNNRRVGRELAFRRPEPGLDPSWTGVVKLTWNRLEGWVFPPASVEQGSTRDEA